MRSGLRDAELSRICKSDYHIRIHQAHESSDWGEAGWKGLILQVAEMPLPMAVLQNGIFSKIS